MFTTKIFEYLICPECKSFSLKLQSFSRQCDEIIEGEILCSNCQRRYTVSKGIPDMLPDELMLKKNSIGSNWKQWKRRLDSFKRRIKGWTEEDSRRFVLPIYEELFHHFCKIEGSVLEIGCGNGVVRHFLNKNVEYWGVDPDEDWILNPLHSFADTFLCLKEPFLFIQGVGECLPFRDKSFDNVIIVTTLDHVNSPVQVFEESYRVLKDNGQILLSAGIGEHKVAKEQVSSLIKRGAGRLFKGELAGLIEGIFRRFFVHEEPDLSFSEDEVIQLFHRFSGLEIKSYDDTLKFFKAEKK